MCLEREIGNGAPPKSEVKRRQNRKFIIEESVDPEKTGKPEFKMVVTGTPFAYRRKDGVIVCPIGCLKP